MPTTHTCNAIPDTYKMSLTMIMNTILYNKIYCREGYNFCNGVKKKFVKIIFTKGHWQHVPSIFTIHVNLCTFCSERISYLQRITRMPSLSQQSQFTCYHLSVSISGWHINWSGYARLRDWPVAICKQFPLMQDPYRLGLGKWYSSSNT